LGLLSQVMLTLWRVSAVADTEKNSRHGMQYSAAVWT